MKTKGLIFFFLIFASCSTSKRGYVGPSDSASLGPSDSQILAKMLTDGKKKARLKDLLSLNYRSPGQEAELNVLKRGGSQREAQLAAKKYERGLTDMEADELNYLEEGLSQREAELQAKADNLKLSVFEKKELDELKFGKKDASSASSQSSLPGLSH